jgi:hypothetical protein
VAAAIAVNIEKNVSDGSLRKICGKGTVSSITSAGTAEAANLVTGLRQVTHLNLTGIYAASNPILPRVAAAEVFPQDGTVSVMVSNNGDFFYEAVGYGM